LIVSRLESLDAESGWITCDLRSTLQTGGTVIVKELLTLMEVKVVGHLIVFWKSIGEAMIYWLLAN
jgi:hypothetical protein